MGKVMQKQVTYLKCMAIAGMIVQKKNFLSRPNTGLFFCVTIRVDAEVSSQFQFLFFGPFFIRRNRTPAFSSKNCKLSFDINPVFAIPRSIRHSLSFAQKRRFSRLDTDILSRRIGCFELALLQS